MNLTSPKVITRLLAENGLAPLKKFGQNFLTDQNTVNKIAAFSVPEGAGALEIGTGLGALTSALCLRARRVVSAEIDSGLYNLALNALSEYKNLTLIEKNILDLDFKAAEEKYFDGDAFYVCGNLPYYITAPIIMHALESGAEIAALTAMVQKEVARRLSAPAGSRDYGLITAAVDFFGGCKTLFNVSASCFYPRPKVDSAVVQIRIKKDALIPFAGYRKVIRAAFAMRRKTILNNFKALYGDKAREIIAAAGVEAKSRPEQLSARDYKNIAAAAEKYGF